jgi:LPXTG-motif cell wall-anchored protein
MKHPAILRCLAMALLLTFAIPVTAMASEPVELVATDITLDQTHFEYTGEEIRPNVTVRAQDQLLTLDQHYTLEFKNNVEVGEAAVVVTGIATGGYTGTVEHPFFIDPKTSDENTPDLITILGTDVTIDGTEFTATGEAIEPGITVTVAGKELTAGEDYTLVYENNIQPGTASVTVTGVADKGYTGSVTIHFTIQEAETQPEESKPEDTQPEETTPEETKPEETKPAYKITKGDGIIWHKESGKDLSFTADGAFKDFVSVQVDGKTVNSKYYTVKEGSTIVTLKESFLEHLDLGKHTITVKFADGEAEATFKISAPADESNPKTGDSIGIWITAVFLSFTGILATAFVYRKKFHK